MSRARDLSKLGNINTFAVDSTNSEVGIASTVPNATLDVRGEVKVGTAVQLGSAGVVTATSFSGSGANLTGLATTETVRTDTITVAGVSTFTGVANFSAAVNADATTDSTSVTTGALIVDGGVGIAKNVYIGAGLSVAGTLTYEDVTNVDSVGIITAKSGVNVTGGQIQVGAAFSVGPAGVVTAASYYGDGSNLSNITSTTINNNADNRLISGSGTANTLNGESTLTYDGTTLALTGAQTISNGETISGGELKVGTGITMAATAGVVTFANAADENSNTLKFGDNNDLTLRHDGANYGYFKCNTGSLFIQGSAGTHIMCASGTYTALYYAGSETLKTTYSGVNITGICTATGAAFSTGNGVLREKCYVVANKLSAFSSSHISLISGMVWYYTTQETTTSTPNIRFSSGITLNSQMYIGEIIVVTVITTAAAAAYSANWTIDGNAVTEEWVGGSAPSEGGSDGLDIYSLTIIKTADATFKVIINLINASN